MTQRVKILIIFLTFCDIKMQRKVECGTHKSEASGSIPLHATILIK